MSEFKLTDSDIAEITKMIAEGSLITGEDAQALLDDRTTLVETLQRAVQNADSLIKQRDSLMAALEAERGIADLFRYVTSANKTVGVYDDIGRIEGDDAVTTVRYQMMLEKRMQKREQRQQDIKDALVEGAKEAFRLEQQPE